MDQEHSSPDRDSASGDGASGDGASGDGASGDGASGDEGLAVLRSIWTAQRQSVVDLGPGTAKVCKNMKNIGFGGLADGGATAVDSTAGPVDDGQRVAWREQLEREGKIPPGSRSLRDLLLDPSEPRA